MAVMVRRALNLQLPANLHTECDKWASRTASAEATNIHKFRQCHALVLLIGGMKSPSGNLKKIASKSNITTAVANPHPEEIHVD